MSLYSITEDLLTVIEGGMVVSMEDGEILFDSDNLEELEGEYLDKLEACGLYVKNEQAEIEAIKAEEKRLADRRRVKENKVQRLKEYMLQSMEATDTKKLDTPKVYISTRKSQKVIIDNENKIPRQFFKVTETVNKTEIKKALKSGTVDGAHIEESVNLTLK